MNRIQKKCIIASAGFHLFLVGVLFIGPGFFTSDAKMDEPITLLSIPEMTTYEKIAGGGSPKGGTPPAPVQQERPPQPEPRKLPMPEKVQKSEPVVKEKEATESFKPSTKPRIEPNLTKITRNTTSQTTKAAATKSPSPESAASKELAALSSTMKNLHSGLSTSTSVDLPLGPGGGGKTYANFYDAIGKVYYDAWVEPEIESSGEIRVDASVTIARSGEVLSARITKPSGNAGVDQSVQATLNRVRFAVPLPAESKESQKVVPIGFTARIKKGTG